MAARRFQTTRTRSAPAAAAEVAAPAEQSPPGPDVSPSWLVTRMGFDDESFWSDPDALGYLDPEVAVETVALAHADAGFPEFLKLWDDRYDHEEDGKSFTGRLIAAAMTPFTDWPLGRSWFHDLFMDLGRLEGALGIELTSEAQLRHGVACYWKRVGVLSKAHAAANKPEPAPERPRRPGWPDKAEVSTPSMKQLALF